MEGVIFKSIFNEIARNHFFCKAFGGWYIENDFRIIVLELQKSNYSNLYYLNIKIYIQGTFGNKYVVNKYLIKNDIGNIFMRQPVSFNCLFDLENDVHEIDRKKGVDELFSTHIDLIVEKSINKTGLKELVDSKVLFLLPAVTAALNF